jgi:uncharacterized protein (TIGR03067 family)
MSRHSAVTGILTALFFTTSGQTGFGPTVAVAAGPALSSFETARVVKYFGYEKAIELRNETTRVVLCPQLGGRILEYSLNGTNSLFVSDEEKAWKPGDRPEASAGRFDIGPELVIPQRPTLWSGEWTGEITGTRSARLTSQKDEATGVQLVRDFVLHEKSSRLLCTQTIRNVSDSVKEWCHWSRTFATGEGICVIPLSEPSRFPNKYVMYEEGSLINARPEDDNIRVRDGFLEILGAPRKPKLGFDSYAGWMAYLTTDDLLFVKKFKTFPDRVYNEAAGLTISVWYPPGPRVELEPIGPRERLEPGQSASFTEEWWLLPQKFPADRNAVDLPAIAERVATETVGKVDLSAQQGTWRPIAAVLSGNRLPKSAVDAVTLRISGDTYEVEINSEEEKEVDRGTFTVDTSRTPFRITINGTSGPNEGKTILGIFEMKDDNSMRVCYDLSGKEFPNEFKAPPGSSRYVAGYRKMKKAKPVGGKDGN